VVTEEEGRKKSRAARTRVLCALLEKFHKKTRKGKELQGGHGAGGGIHRSSPKKTVSPAAKAEQVRERKHILENQLSVQALSQKSGDETRSNVSAKFIPSRLPDHLGQKKGGKKDNIVWGSHRVIFEGVSV